MTDFFQIVKLNPSLAGQKPPEGCPFYAAMHRQVAAGYLSADEAAAYLAELAELRRKAEAWDRLEADFTEGQKRVDLGDVSRVGHAVLMYLKFKSDMAAVEGKV